MKTKNWVSVTLLTALVLTSGCSLTRLNVHQDASRRDNKSWQLGFPTLESRENADSLDFQTSGQFQGTDNRSVNSGNSGRMISPEGCNNTIDPGWVDCNVPGRSSGTAHSSARSNDRYLLAWEDGAAQNLSPWQGIYDTSGTTMVSGFRRGYFYSAPADNYRSGPFPPVTYLPQYRPPPEPVCQNNPPPCRGGWRR